MTKFISTIYDDLTAGFWTYNHFTTIFLDAYSMIAIMCLEV